MNESFDMCQETQDVYLCFGGKRILSG